MQARLMVVIEASPVQGEDGAFAPGADTDLKAFWVDEHGQQLAGRVFASELLCVLEQVRSAILARIVLAPPTLIAGASKIPGNVM